MLKNAPAGLEQTIATRFPDYLDLDYVRHSDWAYTIVLLDLDYKYYTFRMSLSVDGRWTLVPLSGFEYADSLGF